MTQEALKLALDALEVATTPLAKDRQEVLEAVKAIKQAIAELESQEPVGFAGIEMWIGNKRIKKLMTQAELHSAIDPWAIVKFNSDSCIDALKEMNT
jgi:hypothetical protein